MTNGEKYKTVKERAEAFWKQYFGQVVPYDAVEAFATWLDLEAPAEEPLPCPFCGAKCEVHSSECYGYKYIRCTDCEYYAPFYDTESEAISAHNRVARAAKEKEAK